MADHITNEPPIEKIGDSESIVPIQRGDLGCDDASPGQDDFEPQYILLKIRRLTPRPPMPLRPTPELARPDHVEPTLSIPKHRETYVQFLLMQLVNWLEHLHRLFETG